MSEIKEKNAIISSASISIERGFILDAWLHLEYADGGQGFGGYSLYLSKSSADHEGQPNFAGHFIYRCMEIAGVESWDKMKGRSIRVRAEHNKVHEIGHIIKEDWFNPSNDFDKMNSGGPK